ncbi:pleckstrin homology domain-containing family A member 2-like [Rhopilema esculentum]|uniref:pleckstrin homology domain-containing family A member 2-like n=1 Tax=Rhopilema esculentum TaxID=499914 RepID=UPI0031D716AA
MRLIGKFSRKKMAVPRNILGQSITPPTKEGPLFKYRNFWSGWAQRYFKLDKCYVHYFETKHAPEPIDSVPRGSIISVKPSDAFSDKKFVFEIQQKSGTVWFVQASTMEEMIQWIKVLSPVPILLNPDLYPTTTCPEVTYPEPTICAPSAVTNSSGATDTNVLYPNIPQNLYYEFHANPSNQQSRHSEPPPPYSEIVHQNGK